MRSHTVRVLDVEDLDVVRVDRDGKLDPEGVLWRIRVLGLGHGGRDAAYYVGWYRTAAAAAADLGAMREMMRAMGWMVQEA